MRGNNRTNDRNCRDQVRPQCYSIGIVRIGAHCCWSIVQAALILSARSMRRRRMPGGSNCVSVPMPLHSPGHKWYALASETIGAITGGSGHITSANPRIYLKRLVSMNAIAAGCTAYRNQEPRRAIAMA